jgi:hypothetical protein
MLARATGRVGLEEVRRSRDPASRQRLFWAWALRNPDYAGSLPVRRAEICPPGEDAVNPHQPSQANTVKAEAQAVPQADRKYKEKRACGGALERVVPDQSNPLTLPRPVWA